MVTGPPAGVLGVQTLVGPIHSPRWPWSLGPAELAALEINPEYFTMSGPGTMMQKFKDCYFGTQVSPVCHSARPSFQNSFCGPDTAGQPGPASPESTAVQPSAQLPEAGGRGHWEP